MRVLPRKAHLLHAPNLGQARLIENNQRGLRVCVGGGQPGMKEWDGRGWADWERQNGNLMDSWIVGGVLLALRVPRIADSV